jgi:hypothetical protein
MEPYLERTNSCIHLAKILNASGKCQTNLPTLAKYVHPNGRPLPFLCWSSILGRCTFRECRFLKEGGHLAATDITDDFADKCIDVIRKGVIALSNYGGTGGLPPKKTKGVDGGATT